MDPEQDVISAWLATEVIPHEADVRGWLCRRWSHVVEVEDVIQDAYCRLANLAAVDHIESPRAYFFRTAQAVVMDMMRRARIINFTSMTQIDWSNVEDGKPLADRKLAATQELDRVRKLLSSLPETYRRAVELRRIEGLSRKETARRLGVSEDALKKHVERGLHQVMKAMTEQDAQADADAPTDVEQKAEWIGKQRPL